MTPRPSSLVTDMLPRRLDPFFYQPLLTFRFDHCLKFIQFLFFLQLSFFVYHLVPFFHELFNFLFFLVEICLTLGCLGLLGSGLLLPLLSFVGLDFSFIFLDFLLLTHFESHDSELAAVLVLIDLIHQHIFSIEICPISLLLCCRDSEEFIAL